LIAKLQFNDSSWQSYLGDNATKSIYDSLYDNCR